MKHVFETVKNANNLGKMIALRLNHFNPDDFQCMDAPETLPAGSMESWTSSMYPVAQGAINREQE